MKRIVPMFLLIAALGIKASAQCASCHGGQKAALEATAHAAPAQAAEQHCVACHGDASEHLVDPVSGGVLAFETESRADKDMACASCHVDVHSIKPSAHARAGLACADCHSIHEASQAFSLPTGFERLKPGSAACAGCHQDILTQFAFNQRHRLHENSVSCTDCHNPHGQSERLQLGAFRKQRCTTCHTDKEGPFVFEHAASRVEGCVACHTPHGSANRHLLTHQRVGEQCYSCHAEVVQFHLGFSPVGAPRFDEDTVCTNCHSTIHGSNFNRFFLR